MSSSKCELVSWLIFKRFCTFLRNASRITSRYSSSSILTVQPCGKNSWKYHTIEIEENGIQNLHVWLNLTCFLWSWACWTLSLAWLGVGFKVYGGAWLTHDSSPVMTFLSKSGSSLTSAKRCRYEVGVAQNIAVLEPSSLLHGSCPKHT